MSGMTGPSSGIDAGSVARLAVAAPQDQTRAGEDAVQSTRTVLRQAAGALGLAIATGVIYAVAPLYTSNQNQYFLHGLARAGVGFLRGDWLAQTADPTPLFSALVAFTYQYLHPALYFAYYLALAGAYMVSLVGITRRVVDPATTRGGLATYLALLLGMHSALLSRVSLDMVGLDLRTVLTSGVAGQYVLGDYLQPSTFGVLLVVSIFLFVRERPVYAAVAAAAAAVVHPTYLLPAGLLVCGYIAMAYREALSLRAAAGIGLAALAPVVPILVYVLRTFRPTSPETLAVAHNVLMQVRLPHHLLLDRWLNLSAFVQIVLVAAGLLAVRRTPRLFAILLWCAIAAATLTVVQAVSGSATLALLFPWRLSVLLVPICSSVLAARAAVWLRDRVVGPARDRTLVWAGAGVVILLMLAGATVMASDARAHADDPSVPVMDFVRKTSAPGDLYLVPISIERFRLQAGAPIFLDRKAIPYRDVELVEWYARYRLGRELHQINDAELACQALSRVPERYQITHVVLRRGVYDGRCPILSRLYDGGEYGLYRLMSRDGARP